jgi:hypothetical protein
MDRHANRLGSVLSTCAAVLALCSVLSGCISEPAGTRVFGLNESDRDVIVASSHHGGPALVLTAHTWGQLFDDYGHPSGEVTVFDPDCAVLARLPLTRALDTLRIGPQGEIAFIGRGDNILPSGVNRAPDNPTAGGALWTEAACR